MNNQFLSGVTLDPSILRKACYDISKNRDNLCVLVNILANIAQVEVLTKTHSAETKFRAPDQPGEFKAPKQPPGGRINANPLAGVMYMDQSGNSSLNMPGQMYNSGLFTPPVEIVAYFEKDGAHTWCSLKFSDRAIALSPEIQTRMFSLFEVMLKIVVEQFSVDKDSVIITTQSNGYYMCQPNPAVYGGNERQRVF